jgi:hypothetical protein
MALERENQDKIEEQRLAEIREMNEWKSIEQDKQRKHEKELKALDIQGSVDVETMKARAATARLKATTRSDVWRVCVLALVKLPVLPLAVLLVFILEVCGKEIPESLDNFVNI